MNASTAKMWGSNEEREALMRKVDSMTIRHGAPSVFWTLTPNSDCSITCAFWSGQEMAHGRPENLSQCLEKNMPCPSEMSKAVMKNTVVQAENYRVCCRLLIDILFGWDSAARRPIARRGIFGFVEALVYALEQQGRLFVHHHGVAWVAGMPRTRSDWERLLLNPDLKERYERYCASIFSAELPIYDTLDVLKCPRPTCDGRLEPSPILRKYKHLLRSSVSPPIVALCDSCSELLCEKDIVEAEIDRHWLQLDEPNQSISTVDAVKRLKRRFRGLSPHSATARVQLSRLLLMDQAHSFSHTPSCVKGRVGTKCRYRFPRPLVGKTGFNKHNEISMRRRAGNQWLNQFIRLWRKLLHFNMDARVLWSDHGMQATRYALAYTMKRQTVLDNVAVVEMAHKKRVAREPTLHTTEYGLGIGRLLALTHANSRVMEIGGPLATTIILEGEAVTFGCDFQTLVLVQGLNILNNENVDAIVVARGNALYNF